MRFVNFDDDRHLIFREREQLPPEIGIARLVRECDVLINIPLLKLRMAAEAGIGEHRVERIEIVGETLVPRKLELAQARMKRQFPEMGIQEDGACSACTAALGDGLYSSGGARKFSRIALGAKVEPAEDALVLGNCLEQYFPTHAHVAGCPPDGAEIARALRGEGEESGP